MSPKRTASRPRARLAAWQGLVVALYTVLFMILTWPLARHLGTHVPGSYAWAFDEYTFLWNPWWFRYALLNLGQNPLASTHTFYPLGISLVLYTYHLFHGLVSLPLQAFLSLPAISNLLFAFATVGSGYGTFLLVTYLLDRMPEARQSTRKANGPAYLSAVAAFLAGLIYAFGSYRMVYAAIGHYNLWSTTWLPFYALYLLRSVHEPGRRNPALAAVFLVLAMLCDMMFGPFLAMLTLVLLAFCMGRKGRETVAGGLPALGGRMVVLGLVALVLYAPLWVPILREIVGGYDLTGWGDAERLSVDLVGLFTPTALHPLGGEWTTALRQAREGTGQFRDVHTVFLGWGGLALAVIGAVRYRQRLVAWITGLLLFAMLSLGPLLQINGQSTFDLDGLAVNVPLPFILLHYIPVVSANRVPNRFSVVLMLALAVLAAHGAYWLLVQISRLTGRATACKGLVLVSGIALAGLLVFDHWSVPLPLTDARIPSVFESVAAEPGDFAILQLPMGWRNSFGVQGAESTQGQYYQTYHHKRLLSGNISRNPPDKFDYFQRVPILASLITIQTYGEVDADRRAADRSTAAEFVRFYDIRYVAVAPGVPGRPPYVDTRAATVDYVKEVLPVTQIEDQEGWLLYRVEQDPLPDEMTVDVGAADTLAVMALGEGWATAETIQGASARWAADQEGRVFLPARDLTTYELQVTALPFEYPESEPQSVHVEVNGTPLDTVDMVSGWQTYRWTVPATALRTGLNDIRLVFDRAAVPADVLPGNGAIGSTGVQAPIAIEVNSGGPAGFAFITLGDDPEPEDGSVHRPGYNVVVLDPRTGDVLDRRGFDTTPSGNPAEATALAEFVAAIAPGRIVAVAMQGEGASYLDDGAVGALRSLGGQADPRGTAGWSHGLVGVKGAAPGTALEVAGLENGWLRVAPDRRTLAAAIDQIRWTRQR